MSGRERADVSGWAVAGAPVITVPGGEEPVALDLYGAALAESDAVAERARLVSCGFLRGWASAHGDQYAAVYEFATPAGALRYLLDGYDALEAQGARFSANADAAEGGGFRAVAQDSDGFTGYVEAWAAGPSHALVVTGSPERTGALAAEQRTRLAGRVVGPGATVTPR